MESKSLVKLSYAYFLMYRMQLNSKLIVEFVYYTGRLKKDNPSIKGLKICLNPKRTGVFEVALRLSVSPL